MSALAAHHEQRPSPRLSGFVERAVGYRLAGFPAGVHVGMPSTTVTLVIPLDEPLTLSSLADVAHEGRPPRPRVEVILLARPRHLTSTRRVSGRAFVQDTTSPSSDAGGMEPTQTTTETSAETRTDHNVWAGISYDDAHAARAWLHDLGFEDGILVPGEAEGEVRHSKMLWPEGGRVMVHTRGKADDTFGTPRGTAVVYVVVDDPDTVWEAAQRLSAPVVRPMEETDYGSRGFSVSDPEGNSWSFGTYAG